jgi:hypothetical protein
MPSAKGWDWPAFRKWTILPEQEDEASTQVGVEIDAVLKEKVTKLVQIVRAKGAAARRPAHLPGKDLHFSAKIMGRNKEFGSLAIQLETSPSKEAIIDGVMRMPACATLSEF